MKTWIKLPYATLADPRVRRLIKDCGMKGFAIYVVTMLMIECLSTGDIEESYLYNMMNAYTGRNMLDKVLNDYDLFDVGSGLVRVRTRMSVRPSTEAGADTDVHAPEPYNDNSKETIEIEEEHLQPLHAPAVVDEIRSWLLSDRNRSWRESMMMQSGYALLLKAHWSEAVEFFINHINAQASIHDIRTANDAYRYFANFSRLSSPSGKHLKQHLESLTSSTPSAQSGCFNPSTGEISDFYNYAP